MRALWFLAMGGCAVVGSGQAPPLCDQAAPLATRLDGWSGGGEIDGFTYSVSGGIPQHLLVDGDCRYRASPICRRGVGPAQAARSG